MRVKYFRDRGGRRSRCGTNNFGALAQRVIMRQILSNMAAKQRSRKLPFLQSGLFDCFMTDGYCRPANS